METRIYAAPAVKGLNGWLATGSHDFNPYCTTLKMVIFTHLILCFDTATHSFKWVKMIQFLNKWPLSSIINQLCSDCAQLMQITGPGNKHYSGENGLYPDQ